MNSAESIRHRLRNELRARGEDVALGLHRYALERFLYRLGRSPHRDQLILKGATLFAIWGAAYRPTRDLDFTAFGDPGPSAVLQLIRGICAIPDDAGALVFDASSLAITPIRDGAEYDGVRASLAAVLGSSCIPLQLDIGFGDAIVPGPVETEVRTLLGDPPPRILAYPREAVISEKLNAMVTFGERNSRYKDFYDLHALASNFPFDAETLVAALRATFARRRTPLTAALPAALTPAFYANAHRATQWRAFVTSKDLTHAPADFQAVGGLLIPFLQPVWRLAAAAEPARARWQPSGPWTTMEPSA